MRIARIAPLTYTPGKLEYFSFIRSGAGADYHQGPAFYQFPNGDVMIYWGAYDFDECSNNAVVLYSLSRDRGLTWADPQVYMADYPGRVAGARLLGLRASGKALMFVTKTTMEELKIDDDRRVAVGGADYFRSRTRVFLRRSTDGGSCFDHGEELPYLAITGGKELPLVGFYGAMDELTQLENGRIIAAFEFMDPERSAVERRYQHYTVACLCSDDEGRTWRRSTEIVADTLRGAMEPQIVETAPNRLLCLLRTKGGYLYQAASEDGGETWSQSQPSALPSPECMARMIRLQSGNLLLVWNNVSSVTQHPRHPLVAAISRDGGGSWSQPRMIADETGTNQLSNHGLAQLDDGRILLGISHYHDIRPMTSDLDLAIFDEEWLARG